MLYSESTVRRRSHVIGLGPRATRAWKIPGLSKLRIGGSIGKAAEGVKSTLNNTKILGVPLGVGLGAAGGGLGGALSAESSRTGGNLGAAAKNFGQDLIAGAKNVPLALTGVGALGGAAGAGAAGGGGLSSLLSNLPGEIGSAVSGIGSFLGGNGGLNALGAAQGVNAALLNKQSTDYGKQALGAVQDSYNQRAPLRVAGLQGMLKPQTNDLSSLTANSGPYGKGLPAIKPAANYSGTGST